MAEMDDSGIEQSPKEHNRPDFEENGADNEPMNAEDTPDGDYEFTHTRSPRGGRGYRYV